MLGQNVEYARTLLLNLEKSLPGIKPAERRHEIYEEVGRKRKTLGVLRDMLAGLEEEAEDEDEDEGGDEDGEGEDWGDELLDTDSGRGEEGGGEPVQHTTTTAAPATTSTEPTTATASTPAPATTTSPSDEPSSTLRNRHHPTATPTPSKPKPEPTTLASTEQTLTTHRTEQETLTTSLLTLATQLKSSTQNFQSALDSEKSILARAVDGLDRTAGSMEAAEKRMGLLRRMTEGKGWWGRMMLYAWIFAGWVLAILIVFLGPKMRF